MNDGIKHMVIFNLKDNSPSHADKFFEDSRKILSNIPGVADFEIFKQVSKKNDYQYGFSMFFANEDAYKAYNEHTDHTEYVKNIWLKDVETFMEIDFQQR